MGHDIDICEVKADGTPYQSVDSTSLSFNWVDLSDITIGGRALKWGNQPETKIGEKQVKLWGFMRDGHQRSGRSIAKSTQRALDNLKSIGITPGKPDPNNGNWSWGTREIPGEFIKLGSLPQNWLPKTENLPREERLAVFAYHLKRFNELGNKYPHCFFFSDSDNSPCKAIFEPNDKFVEPQKQGAKEPVTWVRHPYKGNFMVHDFKTAMEIFGLFSALNDPRAQEWYNLAFKMPDAPK